MDFKEKYVVYDDGTIYNKISHRYVKPSLSKDGYLIVGIRLNGVQRTCFVHRLVAEEYLPNPENKPSVDHINGEKTDNRVENLRWATAKEQMDNPVTKYRMSTESKLDQRRKAIMKRLLMAEAHWCEKLGRWKCAPQKDGVRKSFYEKTPGRRGKVMCEAKAAEWMDSHDVVDPRFDVAWEQYLAYRKKTVGTSTYTQEESFGRIWLLPDLGMKRLSKISSQHVQDILQFMADKGKAKKTIKGVAGVVSTFYMFCHRNRYCFEKPEISIPEAKEGEHKVLQPSEIAKIFTIKDDDPWLNAYRFCLLTGLRRGELLGMKWEDYKDGVLSIQRSINRFGEITKGKNKNALRTFVLPKSAQDILTSQKESQKGITPWVWPDPDTHDMADPGKFYDHWQSFLRRHDIPAVSVHEIRHTMISMNKATMNKELLKLVVGHSASMDTFGVYGHEMEGDTETAAEIIDSVMSNILKNA